MDSNKRGMSRLWFKLIILATSIFISIKLQADPEPAKSELDPGLLLKKFIELKHLQAQMILGTESKSNLKDDCERFFEMAKKQKYDEMWKIYAPLGNGPRPPEYQTMLETVSACDYLVKWDVNSLSRYAKDVLGQMEEPTVYFGGTDCGRALPAVLCEVGEFKQIRAITQNMLADANYLKYLESSHGTAIKLPAESEFNAIFSSIADQANNDPAIGVKIVSEDGGKRVVIEGIEGVFAINAKVARWVFDKNPRYNFYLEESYPLKWALDYCVPCGAIMKINREPIVGKFQTTIIQSDTEFWDKRVGELTAKPYDTSLDIPLKVDSPRRVYSKMRHAIARLYDHREMSQQAEYAFKQAIQLCPYNHEAVSLFGEFYFKRKKYNNARLVLNEFLRVTKSSSNEKVDVSFAHKALEAIDAAEKTGQIQK